MTESILSLSVLAIMCGALISLIPDGGIKSVAEILATSVLLLYIFNLFGEVDVDCILNETLSTEEIESNFGDVSKAHREELEREVIKANCEEYILDKAEELGTADIKVGITVFTSPEGIPIPYSSEISGTLIFPQKEDLSKILTEDLGIPAERQRWHDV